MRSHPSTRSRVRRGLPALLLLPLLLVLAGCFRLDMGLTITDDETVDVSMEVSDLTGLASREDLDCGTLESQIADTPEEVDFSVEDIENDGNLGCRIVAAGAPIDAMSGEGLSIERVDDTYEFSFDGDESGAGAGAMPEDMPAGMEPEVSISVTFPGEVIEADGEIDGNTVTWTGTDVLTAGGTATGSAVAGGGAGGVSTVVWIILGVVALLAIAALIFFISRRNRGRTGGSADAPYGAPAAAYGPPGQVPADPGPGYAGQPVPPPAGGFGPPDQVPADAGPGYPGQQPPTADPATSAGVDAPVDRPNDPFAPPAPPEAPQPPRGDEPEGDQPR